MSQNNCFGEITSYVRKTLIRNEIKFLSNNNYVLISSLNNQIQVLDLINEQEVTKYTGHKNCQYLLDMKILTTSNDDILIISGSEDNKVYVWNVEDGIEFTSFYVDEGISQDRILNCLSLSSFSNLLATSSFINNDITNTIEITSFVN